MVCPTCEGDGIERCTNPDHGFIQALSFTDIGRLGCPCCGHDEKHRIMGCKCPDCNGTGIIEGAKNTEQQVQPDNSPKMCEECGQYPADLPSNLCCGCDAYKDHLS